MKDFINKNRRVLIAAVLPVLILIGLVAVAPKLPLWSYSFTSDPSDAMMTDIREGDSYELSFYMPYDKISGIDVFMASDELTLDTNIVPFDADLTLTDENGNPVYAKHMTSVFDTASEGGYVNVTNGSLYTLRFTVNSIDLQEGSGVPQIKAASSNSFSFSVQGCHNGAPDKTIFFITYIIFSIVIVLYVYSFDSRSKELKSVCEKMLLLAVSLTCILFLGQSLDMEMVARSAFKMCEALKSGQLLNYYDYAYSTSLNNGADFIHLGYNYDFFLVFPVAIVLFPLSFFMDSYMPYWQGYNAVIILLTVCVFALLLLSANLIGRICRICGMSSEYELTVKRFFLFSPAVLCASIAFGQIDIIYVVVILTALIFYYKANYKAFTALMSLAVAMKLFPLLIFIPLLLLVKKKPLELIGHGAGVLVVPLISTLLFKHGAGYSSIMNIAESEYGFSGWLFERTFDGLNALFPIIFAVICVYAYVYAGAAAAKADLLRTSMLLIFAAYADLTVFSTWHFQWLIPLFLSLSFLIPMYSKKNTVLLLGIALEVLILLWVMGDDRVSVYEINFLLPVLYDHEYRGVFISEIMKGISPHLYTLIVSLTTGVLGILSFFMFRKNSADDKISSDLTLIRRAGCLRITALYAVVIFFIWCYCYIG